jgi:hypothetical protein
MQTIARIAVRRAVWRTVWSVPLHDLDQLHMQSSIPALSLVRVLEPSRPPGTHGSCALNLPQAALVHSPTVHVQKPNSLYQPTRMTSM